MERGEGNSVDVGHQPPLRVEVKGRLVLLHPRRRGPEESLLCLESEPVEERGRGKGRPWASPR